MSVRHWTDDELIGRIYGLEPGDGHLAECEECAGRWRALEAARGLVLDPPPAPEEFLAGQRRAIHDRLEHTVRRPGWLELAPAAVATAAVVVLAVVLYRPPSPAPQPGLSDAELYGEVYSMVQSDEPLAIQPIRAMFEVEE
jgi:hypothetical protein